MASSDRNEKRLISALMICNGIAASAAEQTEIRRQANELAEELCGQIETFLRLKKKMDTDDQRVWSQVQQMRTTIDQRRMLIG